MQTGPIHLPALGQSWSELTLGIELGEVVEQEGHDFAGRDVGRESRSRERGS
jgi:hypothetical protein